ncbi:hypothetical protein SZ42_05910 [Brachyspira hyodysenteriae]|nr:hypothetical protein SZ42_05910 [Brachyspira hyodysenteriae]
MRGNFFVKKANFFPCSFFACPKKEPKKWHFFFVKKKQKTFTTCMGYFLLNIISHTCSFFYATGGLRQKNQKIFIKFMTQAVSPCLDLRVYIVG